MKRPAITVLLWCYLGNFTQKKSFAKNNTNSDLFSGFVLFAYGGDEGARTHDLSDVNRTLWPAELCLRKYRYRLTVIFSKKTNNSHTWVRELWWRRWGSNPWPMRCERIALPAELRPRNSRFDGKNQQKSVFRFSHNRSCRSADRFAEKSTYLLQVLFSWRRKRDSNPRTASGGYTISNRARSTNYAISP